MCKSQRIWSTKNNFSKSSPLNSIKITIVVFFQNGRQLAINHQRPGCRQLYSERVHPPASEKNSLEKSLEEGGRFRLPAHGLY